MWLVSTSLCSVGQPIFETNVLIAHCSLDLCELPYLGSCPSGFVDMADVVLVVNGKRLPAHSQFLASQSRLFESLLKDTGSTFSKVEPLIISSPLQTYREVDVVTFLRHVYKDQPLQSEQEAWDLLPIADQFDSPSLCGKAVLVIEAAQGNSLFSNSSKDVIAWWQLADRFNLHSFKSRCVKAVAQQFETLQHDARLLELKPAAAVELMQALQQVLQDRTRVYWVRDTSLHGCPGTYLFKHYFCTANRCSGHSVSVGWGSRFTGGDGGYELKHKTKPERCPGAQVPAIGVDVNSAKSKECNMKAFESQAIRGY